MKPFLLAAIAFALPAGALAQSPSTSVTMYGFFDVSGNYIHFSGPPGRPSAHLWTLSSDTSRLGFRGIEDLGGGQRAYFKLEHGLNVDTGSQTSPTAFFNRESYVGLGDDTFGSLQLGSQFSPDVWTSGRIDPFGRLGLGAIVNLFQGLPRGWPVSYNNVIQYISPKIANFTGRLMAAAGEGAPTGSSYAGSLDYANGPLYVALNYDQPKTTAASVGLTGDARWSRTWSGGATYDFNVIKLHGWYQTNRVDGVPDASGWLLGITAPIGTGTLAASYTRRLLTNADASLAAVGYTYYLSKRTALYTQLARLDNSGTAAFGLGPSRVEQAAAGQLGPGRDVKGLQLGVRHSF